MKNLFVIALLLMGSAVQSSSPQLIAGLNGEETLRVVNCIASAYSKSSPVQVGDNIQGYTVRELLPDNFGFVGLQNRTVLVAVRGTDRASLAEWLRNLDCEQEVCNFNGLSGHLHSGFQQKYKHVWKVIFKAYGYINPQNPQYSADRLILTGHSSGGPVVSIAYLSLCSMAKLGNQNVRIDALALGSPGVFNQALATSFQNQVGNRFGNLVTFNHSDDWVGMTGWQKAWAPIHAAEQQDSLSEAMPVVVGTTWKAVAIGPCIGNVTSGGFMPQEITSSGIQSAHWCPPHALETYQNTLLQKCLR